MTLSSFVEMNFFSGYLAQNIVFCFQCFDWSVIRLFWLVSYQVVLIGQLSGCSDWSVIRLFWLVSYQVILICQLSGYSDWSVIRLFWLVSYQVVLIGQLSGSSDWSVSRLFWLVRYLVSVESQNKWWRKLKNFRKKQLSTLLCMKYKKRAA
jgi:hypothetical protein